MYIYGSFKDIKRRLVTVYIVTRNDRTEVREIGVEASGMHFADDPVSITSEVNDTFDPLLRHSATIRLLVRDYVPDFFCPSARDAVVNIYRDGVCLFAGFIEPQAYSQPYNEVYDEIELSCIDVLSALQYSKYKNIGSAGVSYADVKSNASQSTFHDILTDIMDGITEDIDILGGHTRRILFDGSKCIDAASAGSYLILSHISASELLFLGDDESDVWQQDAVIAEMMRYLDLHIVQDGFDYYIFAWETVRGLRGPITWKDITTGDTETTLRATITIAMGNVEGADTQISIGEVYNQLLLTCENEAMPGVVESPLDSAHLTSPYVNKQKYCTEYSVDRKGMPADLAFAFLAKDINIGHESGLVIDWYLQVRKAMLWTFPQEGTGLDLIDVFCHDGTNQQNLPNWLAHHPGAAVLSMGSVEMNTANDDNKPVSKVNMTDCLVMAVNGNGLTHPLLVYPNEESIKAAIPYAVYTGNSAGGVFSPADDEVTNYIVISGKVILNGLMEESIDFTSLREREWNSFSAEAEWEAVPSSTDDWRYYTRRYWKAEHPNDTPEWDRNMHGLIPFSGKGRGELEFEYSAIGDSTDTVSKVAAIACMLVIGDKCVVETGTQGQPSDFTWQTYKTREQCASDDEYYQQCFTIGFDPKIGDILIGTEFDIQNNIIYTMNVDAEGTAIPIHKSDKVSGQVHFIILGPVNSTWDVVTRRHPSFWRHTEWTSETVPILAKVSNIIIKSFEVKVYSDNGQVNNTTDDDIVYMSDTTESYVNKKDDLTFKICSALTSAECQQLGVTNSVSMSTPLNTQTGDALLSIYDCARGEQAKPERIYVDSYYNEYHKPRVLLTQKMREESNNVSLFNHYIHPALGKTFHVMGISRNLREGWAELTTKEIAND